MAVNEAALVCGFPYSGKSTMLEASGEPFLKVDDFLQERYGTTNSQTVGLKLAMERKEAIEDFAIMARKKALEMDGERLWIEGMFTQKEERIEMKNALQKAGFRRVGCLVLANVKLTAMLDRCQNSKKEFKCNPSELMHRIDRFESPSADEKFAWIEFIQPANVSLREDPNWGVDDND